MTMLHSAFTTRSSRDRLSTRLARKVPRYRPRLEALEERMTPAAIVVGAAPGSAPRVVVYANNGTTVKSFLAYPAAYRGGVNVTQADLTGDGVPDIVTAQTNGNSQIKIFDGLTFKPVRSFWAYGRRYRGGVNVAAGLVSGTSESDIITGQAHRGSQVKVFDGQTLGTIAQFAAYGAGVNGVRVATANLDGSSLENIVTAPGPGGAPELKAFTASGTMVRSVMAFDPSFQGGVELATGNFEGGPNAEVAAATGPGTTGTVRVFGNASGNPLISQFQPFGAGYTGGVELGTVHMNGSSIDSIAVAQNAVKGARRGTASSFTTVSVAGAPVGTTSVARVGTRGIALSSAAPQVLYAYAGAKQYAVAYSPTWPNWGTNVAQQLQDSDLFNDSFKGLWGTDNTGKGRNDLQTIADAGFNLVRLYNWGPSRQGPANQYDAHLSFLDKAQSLNLKVIVPVSDYFLSSDAYAWVKPNTNIPVNPDANFSFGSAPKSIQDDLNQFVASITKNGKLHPAVQSISIGNEMDLGISSNPDATSKLERAMWWVVNLQQKLSSKFGSSVPAHFLTIPISNADQGVWSAGKSTGGNSSTTLNDTNLGAHPPWGANVFAGLTITINQGTGSGQTRTIVSNTSTQVTIDKAWDVVPDATSSYVITNATPVSWFQVFAHGTTTGERVPIGTVPDGPAGRFTANVKGLETYDWYTSWFYNSLNLFQTGTHLQNTLTQYDTGVPTGTNWDSRWPGEKLDVPLLVTELGTTRFNITQDAQFNAVAITQAQVAEDVLKTSTNLMGYTAFEFNDEPNKNNLTDGPSSEKFFGLSMYNTNQNQFRNGQLLYTLHTGTTRWAGGTMPDYSYPVYKLIPVKANDGTTLFSKLKSIFAQVK